MRLFTFRYLALTTLLLSAVNKAATGQEITVTARAPEPTALEKQLASLQVQRQSVQKQIASIQPRVVQTARRETRAVSSPVIFSDPVPTEMPAAPWPEPMAQLDCPPLSHYEADSLIGSAARAERISPALLRAVMKRESGFRPCAVSEKGAQGLMQLMPATAQEFGVFDPFDPQENVRGGAALLKQLLVRYAGDVRLALSAYNAGSQRVEQAGGVPEIAETQNYVTAITADLGMTDPWNQPPVPAESDAPEPANTVTKPDLSHVVLASPSLNFIQKATPVHLASDQ